MPIKALYTLMSHTLNSFAVFGLLFCSIVNAQPIIKSSVSPEFKHGLHTKYLEYIAEQAGLRLEIYPMPYARRLASLRDGTINLMVGINSIQSAVGFELLQPSYEQLRAAYFVRANSSFLLTPESPTDQMIAGFTINESVMLSKARDNFKAVVTVTNLEQKIRLLKLERIDTFAHFESSARFKIRELGFEQEIVPAAYQPGEKLDYHFAINPDSDLYGLKLQLEQLIKAGVARDDFAKIRYEHELLIHSDSQD